MKKSLYAEKFKDPRWQKKRLKILERDDFTCQICFDKKATLHVHHKYYVWGKNPWDYPDCALETLCYGCHEGEQEAKKEYEPLLIQVLYCKGFMADDIREIAYGFSKFNFNKNPHIMAMALSQFLEKKGSCKSIMKNSDVPQEY